MADLDQVTVWASDAEASRRFFDVVLAPLTPAVGTWRDFQIAAVDEGSSATHGLHVAFLARSRTLVDAFWQAGVDAGYESDGEPGERSRYAPAYYGGFLLDPDGNSVEAVNPGRPRQLGSLVDHLWIRVPDLVRARQFWEVVAPPLGLTIVSPEGDDRFQVVTATRSLMLVLDDRRSTERVELRFSVSDAADVELLLSAAGEGGYEAQADGWVLDPDGNRIGAVEWSRSSSRLVRPPRGDREAFIPPVVQRTPWTADQLAGDVARDRAESGLAADRDSVRRAIENSERPDYPWPGLYYTSEEERESDLVSHSLFDEAEAVFSSSPDDLAQIQWWWHEGRRAIKVTVTRDRQRYEQELIKRLGTGRVVVETAWYSQQQLRALQDRVSDDFETLAQLGIEMSSLGVRDPYQVEFEYFSRYRDQARQLLIDRYGPALDPVWRGPSITAEELQPFGSWITERERLTVFYLLDVNGDQPGSCTVDEHDDRVVVELTVIKPQGARTLAGGGFLSEATALLSRPLGTRSVIDAATGQTRTRWSGANGSPLPTDWNHLTGDGSRNLD